LRANLDVLAECNSLVNNGAELGLVCMLKNLDTLLVSRSFFYIGVLLGRTGGWRPLVISLKKRENVLLISRTVEITLWAGGTCTYEDVEIRSNHIRLRIVDEFHTDELDGYWISRPNSVIMASPIIFGNYSSIHTCKEIKMITKKKKQNQVFFNST
jgi:hypothetical protein